MNVTDLGRNLPAGSSSNWTEQKGRAVWNSDIIVSEKPHHQESRLGTTDFYTVMKFHDRHRFAWRCSCPWIQRSVFHLSFFWITSRSSLIILCHISHRSSLWLLRSLQNICCPLWQSRRNADTFPLVLLISKTFAWSCSDLRSVMYHKELFFSFSVSLGEWLLPYLSTFSVRPNRTGCRFDSSE